MQTQPHPTLQRLQCFLHVPFLHRFSSKELEQADVGTSHMWSHWFSRLYTTEGRLTDVDRAFDYSYFFLPHVRRLLFPELDLCSDASQISQTLEDDEAFEPSILRDTLTGTERNLDFQHSVLRLTYSPPNAPLHKPLRLAASQSYSSHQQFSIDWMDALLFPQHIGVLLFQVSLSDPIDPATTAEFLRSIRKSRYRRRLTVPVPDVVDPSTGQSHSWGTLVEESISPLRSATKLSHSIQETIGSTFKTLVIASWNLPNVGEPKLPFSDELEQATFALATGHTPNGETGYFTDEGMQELRRNRSLQSWANWRVLGYDEGLAIGLLAGNFNSDDRSGRLATTASRVHEISEWAYSLCHVLATVQYTRLQVLYDSVSRMSPEIQQAAHEIVDVEQDYVKFRKVLWHPEVTLTPVGRPIYGLLRSMYTLDELLANIDGNLEVVRTYVNSRTQAREAAASRRTSLTLEILTFVGLPLGLIITALQAEIERALDPYFRTLHALTPVLIVGALALTLVLVYWGVRSLRRPDRHTEEL